MHSRKFRVVQSPAGRVTEGGFHCNVDSGGRWRMDGHAGVATVSAAEGRSGDSGHYMRHGIARTKKGTNCRKYRDVWPLLSRILIGFELRQNQTKFLLF